MGAEKKLLLLISLASILSLLFQTPNMLAVGGGQHRFISGNNVDCLSCHKNYPNAPHQVGLAGHQSAAENRNYTTYLEVGGTSYDPAGFIYTNIDSDFKGGNDVWVWDGYMWIYENQTKRYDLDFNDDGIISGSETCKLCHNRVLMRISVQERPEHTFGSRYCNDARCHGNSNEDYRFFKSGYNTIPPASISDPVIKTGNFYINNTWTNPSDPDFNYTLFNYNNGTFLIKINSPASYVNFTLSPHYIQNISAQTVDNYNNVNQTKIWFNASIPNNPPILTPIGEKYVMAGNLLQFNITANDIDNDLLNYSTNSTNGTLTPITGAYSWQTTGIDAGTYTWYFNSSDPFQGTASETITITVTPFIPESYLPPVPVTLSSTQSNFWINHSWQPGSGNVTDSYNISVNALWTNGTSITFNNITVLPHGWNNITVYAYNNSGLGSLSILPVTGNIQLNNNVPIQSPTGDKSIPAGNMLNFNIISTDADTDPITYGTNATRGTLTPITGAYSWQTTGIDAGTYTWYFNSSDPFQGTASETITITVTPFIPDSYLPPVPVTLSSTQSNFWINHSWQPGSGNVTDSYNISVNGLWTNGTSITFNNITVPPHGWNNITVYAYNNSGLGSLSILPVTGNIQLNNNVPIQSPTGDKSIPAGNMLNFNITSTDADTDPITYGTNATRGTLNPITGAYSWQTTGIDAGTYTWYFNSSDPFQGTASETITITVTPFIPESYLPPVPVTLSSTQSNFWINHSWQPGSGNVTDSYNISVNDLWTNGTSVTYRNITVPPHGWSNITVYAYNNSGLGSLSSSSISQNTQIFNNAPVQDAIGNKSVTEGQLLSINVNATDADSDTLTYSTNATKGSIDPSSGVYTWTPATGDAGQYTRYFETGDSYGGVDTETIIIIVNLA